MLKYGKNYNLKIVVSDKQKQEALEGFKDMVRRMNNMGAYLEAKDTPEEKVKEYEPMYINAVSSVSQSYNILKAMGVPEEEIKKCIF